LLLLPENGGYDQRILQRSFRKCETNKSRMWIYLTEVNQSSWIFHPYLFSMR